VGSPLPKRWLGRRHVTPKALGQSLKKGLLAGVLAGFVAGWAAFTVQGSDSPTSSSAPVTHGAAPAGTAVRLPPVPEAPVLPPVPTAASFQQIPAAQLAGQRTVVPKIPALQPLPPLPTLPRRPQAVTRAS